MTTDQSTSFHAHIGGDTRFCGVNLIVMRSAFALALCSLLAACSILSNSSAPALDTYTLGNAGLPTHDDAFADLKGRVASPSSAQVLLVDTPRAAAGYNSTRMVYVRQPLTQEAFTRSMWVDTPARMLAPLLVGHLQQSGMFRAVLQAPSGAQADLRLDTTVLRLQQDFLALPSRVHVEWQLSLMDNKTRQVLASHRIQVTRLAPSDDAVGGAWAANAATQEALRQTTDFVQSAMVAVHPPQHKD